LPAATCAVQERTAMIRLSTAAELAVRGVIVLAEHYGRGPMSLAAVCARRNLSKEYLNKLFAAMARAGIVVSIRGKGGGYVLARRPEDISVLQVIEAVEGPLAVNFCQHVPPRCDNRSCKVRPAWTDIQSFIHDRLDSLTLAGCHRGHGFRPPGRRNNGSAQSAS